MPLYEYHCEGCGRDFEEQQSLNFNPADTECLYCNQKKAVRKISAVSMSIKGPTRKPRTSDIKAEQGMKKAEEDRKSTRLNSSHGYISYAVFCLKKKKKK